MKHLKVFIDGNTRQNVVDELRAIASKIESGTDFETNVTHNFSLEDIILPEIEVDPSWQDEYDHTQNYEEVFG